MIIKISNEDLYHLNCEEKVVFPKYVPQIINLANQNAQGTRPKNVGQLSEEFVEYQNSTDKPSVNDWHKWYIINHPDAIDNAVSKIMNQIANIRNAAEEINDEMVKLWVTDLIINKTYNGLYIQEAILSKLAQNNNLTYRMSTPEEESMGIDGYIGDIAYSVKPDTYKHNALNEKIDAKMIYYKKTKQGLEIETEE